MAWKYFKKYRLQTSAIGICSGVVLLAGQAAIAQGAGSCLRHPAKLSQSAVDGFRERPGALLANHPAGGVLMTAAVRRLAGSDIAIVPALVSLARDANVAQVVAVGAGLARAVTVCKRLRPDLAQRIKGEVERAAIPALSIAFAASLSVDDVAVMGGPDKTAAPGMNSTSGPEPTNVLEYLGDKTGLVGGPRPYTGSPSQDNARSLFGNGGVSQAVVKPVSPAR